MVPVVHWSEKQPGLCWRLPFTKAANNIRRTTGFSAGYQTVYHVHTIVYLHCDNNVASLRHAVHQLENCIFDICDWMWRNALKPRENQCLVVVKDKIEESEYKSSRLL